MFWGWVKSSWGVDFVRREKMGRWVMGGAWFSFVGGEYVSGWGGTGTGGAGVWGGWEGGEGGGEKEDEDAAQKTEGLRGRGGRRKSEH